jgi:hypothetical protein
VIRAVSQAGLDTATPPARSTRPTNRVAVVALAAVGALACNLMLYVIGRACGGTFTYVQNGKTIRVDAAAVAIMSVVPLTVGLALAAWLSRTWPPVTAIAKGVAAILAVATIGLMTVPAGFDTTSTLFLATMHLALVPAAVVALEALASRR